MHAAIVLNQKNQNAHHQNQHFDKQTMLGSTPRLRPLRSLTALVVLLLTTSMCAIQTKPTGQVTGPAKRPKSATTPKTPAQHETVNPAKSEDWQKYSAVIAELIKFQAKLQSQLQFPASRSQSRLLPLLPESTLALAALPNYGSTLHQATLAFQREREDNPTLRNWWKNDVGADGAKIDDALDRIYQASQFLGDEVVISATSRGTTPVPIIVAEVKKPGLKAFLQQANKDLSTTPNPALRIIDPAELGSALPVYGAVTHAADHGDEAIVLVRPDFVVVGFDLDSVRAFNSQLDKNNSGFAATAFAHRISQTYQSGAGVVAGADLQKILALIPMNSDKDRAAFQRTGFGDLKYLIWEHKDSGEQSTSQSELSFTGPRRGMASWLASPGTLSGLDFVSPDPAMVIALNLKNPAQIFDDVTELASTADSNPLAALPMMEAQMQVNLKQDLLSKLTGEIIIEVKPPVNQALAWKAALRVNDAAGLQQTLARLLASASVEARQEEDGGVLYHSFMVPSGPKSTVITYTFVDGYFVLGSGREVVADAVRFHRSGGSLVKSGEFNSWLPPGHTAEASGFVYQNIGPMLAQTMGQMSPDMGGIFGQALAGRKPTVMWLYGDTSAIREAHTGGTLDMNTMLLGAAVAIPNLLRSKITANDSAAAASLRTVNTAEVTYQVTYPNKGYARNLALMGSGPGADCTGNYPSPAHACLLNEILGCAGVWCIKSGYRFHVAGICMAATCTDYVALATPLSDATGSKSYCSTSDAVVRVHAGPPLESPISVAACRKWQPIQ
jgi:type IV pilus assembly protein PilA